MKFFATLILNISPVIYQIVWLAFRFLPPHARERKKNHLDVAGIEPGLPGKQATMPFITPRLSLKAQSSNMATLVHLYRDYRELVTDIRACRENLLPSSHHPLYEFPSALNSDA